MPPSDKKKILLMLITSVLAGVLFLALAGFALYKIVTLAGPTRPPETSTHAPSTPNLQEIRKLPVGLTVTHTPDPVRPFPNGRSGSKYTWLYETKVTNSLSDKTLTIVEFGAFSPGPYGQWTFGTYTGKPFTSEDFADWYACPDAKLSPGQSVTDPQNWAGGNQITKRLTLWYFIAQDEHGNRCRGEAISHQSDELTTPPPDPETETETGTETAPATHPAP